MSRYRSPQGNTPPPSTFQVFQHDMIRVYLWILRQLRNFIQWTFDITQHGAQRRRNFIYSIFIISWVGSALLFQPIRWALWRTEPASLLLDLGGAFLGSNIFRHVIVLLLAYWLSFRLAAIYLDDIFELGDVAVAERFIRQAAFASQYDWITIRDGRISPESRNSPIYRIGGPGMVLIHLENAALFEKTNGQPHIIGSQGGEPVLESFERLREVIDLRDQVVDMTVKGRSRDGIHVTAKDVRLIFSVYRGESQPFQASGLPQPFSYTNGAIKNLVYHQHSGPWTLAVRSLIRESLRRFIAEHSLSEFLASVSPFERYADVARNLAEDASAFDQASASRPSPTPASVGDPSPFERPSRDAGFISRDQITGLFYDFTHGFSRRAVDLGAQLKWIGVGTWETPSEIIPEQHLEAWQISLQNQLLGNEHTLRQVRQENRNKELLRLIREVPLTSFGRMQAEGLEPETINQELLLTYREKLRNAWEIYQNNGRAAPPELEAALKHLTRLTARWLV